MASAPPDAAPRRAARLVLLGLAAPSLAALAGCGLSAIGGVLVASSVSRGDSTTAQTPRPVSVTTPTVSVNDRVPIAFTLADPSIASFDVLVEYSADGPQGTFGVATEALGAPSQGTVGLAAAPAGVPHVFVWNAFYDLDRRQIAQSPDVVVRVTAFTSGAAAVGSNASGRFGEPGATGRFTVDDRLIATIAGTSATDGEGIPAMSVPLDGPACAVITSGAVLVADTGGHRVRRADQITRIVTTSAGSAAAGFSGDGGTATGARLLGPRGLALDASGNIVIADSGNHRVRRVAAATGLITTIAGIGSAGFTGDGGPATAARLSSPQGLVIDAAGSIYVCDTGNHAVRVIEAGGAIRTIAGTGAAGAAGDGGPATGAQLSSPEGLSLDPVSGDLFVADTGNHAVRRVRPGGAITTVAGVLGTAGLAGEAVSAQTALLRSPRGVCVVGAQVFVSDSGNHRLRRFTPGGAISTVAGALTGVAGFTGDNGPGSASRLSSPAQLAPDGKGGVVFGDAGNHRVRQLDVNGVISTVVGVGTPSAGSVGDGGPAVQAKFAFPEQIGLAADGTVLIADSFGLRIRRFVVGGAASTVAGSGIQGAGGNGGPAINGTFNFPRGVSGDASGNVFIADSNNSVIRHVSPVTGIVTIVAGTGAAGNGADGVNPTASALSSPRALLAIPGGILLMAETTGHRVRQMTYTYDATTGVVTPGLISTVCGTAGTPGFAGDGAAATAARLTGPTGLARDEVGRILVADNGNQVLRRFTLGGTVETIAGTAGTAGFAGDGGAAKLARFSSPINCAVDTTSGAIYVSDNGNDRVRRIAPGGQIDTVAGNGQPGDLGAGGPATSANVTKPHGIVVDATGAVIVAMQGTGRFARFTPGGTLTVVAGAPTTGSVGDGGPAVQATLTKSFGSAPTLDGERLFICDSLGNRIREVDQRTGLIRTISGNGVWGFSGDGGPASGALVGSPFDLVFDGKGALFIADKQNNAIRKLDLATNVMTTVAGTGVPGFSGDGGPATAARIFQPNGVAISSTTGNLYICEFLGSRIRKVDPSGTITTVAGTGGAGGSQADNVPPTTASVFQPSGVAVDSLTETIYVAEFGRHRVRKFGLNGNIFTVAGVANVAGYNGDSLPGVQALLSSPSGVEVDRSGNIYIAEAGGHRVRKVDPSGFITTLVGDGIPSSGPDGVLPSLSRVNFPSAVKVDPRGNIYVSEFFGSRIRRFRAFP